MDASVAVVVQLLLLATNCNPLPVRPGQEGGGTRAEGGPFSPDFVELLGPSTQRSPDAVADLAPSAEALKFLQSFGYLEKGNGDVENFYSGDAVVSAIKQMQMFGAIPQTGVLDNATVQLMHKPRCGVSDVVRNNDPAASPNNGQPLSTRRRIKRFVKGSEGWRKRTITYFISNWSPKLSEESVASEMQKAFQVWADYGNLKFIRTNKPDADIIVAFARGQHHDGYPFDGPGLVLAHAFYPYEFNSFGGDIHFDDDEKWKLKLDGPFDDGVDFFSVAVHELGHSLGLAHSAERDSVMFPYFKGFSSSPARLAYDDVLAMYHMYVSKNLPLDDKNTSVTSSRPRSPPPTSAPTPRPTPATTTTPRPTTRAPYRTTTRPTPRPTHRPHHPHHGDHPHHSDKRGYNATATEIPSFEGDYDTVTSHRKKFGYSTAGFGKLTQPTEHETASTTLRTVAEKVVPETEAPRNALCEGGIDEMALIRGEIFVLKGSQLWRLSEKGATLPGYPVPFKRLFWQLPQDVTSIDAIYERPSDNAIVIFSGTRFWETDGTNRSGRSFRPLSDLGLPPSVKKIDAIMVWGKNKKTYIFSENNYWKLDDDTGRSEAGYPLKITERWRGVPNNIDAAMTFKDGQTYFFKGKNFWRFDNNEIKTERQYPKLASKEWLGCA